MLGVEREGIYPTVLVRFGDAWRFGFQIEVLEAGMVVVFVPGAPSAHSGQIYLLTADRVSPVGAPPARALKCLSRLGMGAGVLLRGLPFETATAKQTENQPDSEKPNQP